MLFLSLSAYSLAGCASIYDAPLLDGMGDFHYKISTNNDRAQKYFDQGLVLSYGFNHAEAERSFRTAARLDPECAMCWWGAALVVGPNINAPMEAGAVPRAWEALSNARALLGKTSEKEQALIAALAQRYSEDVLEDRSALDQNYVASMQSAFESFPDDVQIATLYAEALMDLHPWDYWHGDGRPKEWTPKILEVLEGVMERAPDHPGANHFYIHAVEASKEPDRGLPAAERLSKLVPGAGHLVHMPSHIYIRTGRYHEGSEANLRAIASDHDYIVQCRQQDTYPVTYHPHNHHFLWATASLEGRSELAIEAAHDTAEHAEHALMCKPGIGGVQQHFRTIPYYAYVRFWKWNVMLAEPRPEHAGYPTGVWHYGRGMAFAAKRNLKAACGELEALQKLTVEDALESVKIWEVNSVKLVLTIASQVLEGEIAFRDRRIDDAIALLEAAVSSEGELVYGEPSDWFYPVRQSLGYILLQGSRPEQAEQVYRADLEVYPENGWSLFGLAKALRGQGKTEEAREVEMRFKEAWKWADVKLRGSRF
jgi:tetratricopeptide (TPR) repeat protein